MNILAIDTSTSLATISLSIGDQIAAEVLLNTERSLSAKLLPEIERLVESTSLAISDIDVFASSVGPGSFTGVRGGVATIQGLAMAVDRPAFGFSSLKMLAMNFSLSANLICPMLDARKNEVYGALYNCATPLPTTIIEDAVLPPTELLEQIAAVADKTVIFVGEGAIRYRSVITEAFADKAVFAPFPLNIPHASNGILLTINATTNNQLIDPSRLLPVYLRASDAEIMKLASLDSKRKEAL